MLDNLNKYDIILASNSPRRKELLQRLGIKFRVNCLYGIDETYPDTLPAEDIALYVANKKAEAYRDYTNNNELIITADTTVICNGQVMGKPHDVAQAKKMLRQLSGNTHQVVTGVVVQTQDRIETLSVSTDVKFAKLSADEIDYYVDNFLPFDKAGSYGIQEWIGLVAVEELRGSFFNVMGLPIQRLYTALKAF